MTARPLALAILLPGLIVFAPPAAADVPICAPLYVACFYENAMGDPACELGGTGGAGSDTLVVTPGVGRVIVSGSGYCYRHGSYRYDWVLVQVIADVPLAGAYVVWHGTYGNAPNDVHSCRTMLYAYVVTPIVWGKDVGCPAGPAPNVWGDIVP